ncbi:transcriptional regulator [Tardibacter chloracetimidivorans]|uniref:Transcriptional regulator n=1 Tax=Tardibacter chloracetimidivorans TaxID=1921510 RepID=A0A1L3ZU09_9SPHN|nr:helix-turn-helix transcriptional regulator [Tardibacter chloracetimidivorans]API59124.1 transcriptional regulator [Tardibacter chloracetimidivorans]
MITCIREVRKAKGLTLQDVAERCDPPTTPQTVGRLETGTRTVSVAWLNRIAGALGVDPSQLVTHPDRQDLPVVAILGASGVNAPRKAETAVPPRPSSGALAMPVTASIGDYRAGDLLWLERLAPDRFGDAINRDVLVPRPAGRFLFARLIGREEGKLHLLPLTSGARQTVVAAPPWMGVATTLIREL